MIYLVILVCIIVVCVKVSHKNREYQDDLAFQEEMYNNSLNRMAKTMYSDYNLQSVFDYGAVFVNTNKKIIHVERKDSPSIDFGFEDIIRYDVYENGYSSGDCALAGALLAGTTGAIVGRSMASQHCDSLQMRIVLNNANDPEVVIKFLCESVSKDSVKYKSAVESMRRVTSFMEYAIRNK